MKAGLSENLVRGAFGLALLGASTGASAADLAWAGASSPNGLINVETICTPAEVAAGRQLPDNVVASVTFMPDSRVLCMKGDLMFVAGELEVADVPAGSSLFDLTLAQGEGDTTAQGTPSRMTIGGKRAYLNREVRDGMVAQTGLVEIDRTKMVFLLAGGSEHGRLSVQKQGEAVDRFYASIKVTGK